MAIAPRTTSGGAVTNGNNAAMSWTVPAGCATGDVILLHSTQNNADLITVRHPSVVVRDWQRVNNFHSELCTIVVDGERVVAGTVIPLTLSATRAWQVVGQAFTGVDPGYPIAALAGSYSAAGASMATPSADLEGYLVEAGSMKSNGSIIASWTGPAGWTIRQQAAAGTTFAPSGFIATYDSNPALRGTFGGDTYTPSVAGAGQSGWTLALNELGYRPPAVSYPINRRRP